MNPYHAEENTKDTMPLVLKDIEKRVAAAVAHYWTTLARQSRRQRSGDADRGGRAAVTAGKQMDGFGQLVSQVLKENGIPEPRIFRGRKLELPGYFRPTKKWDLVVVCKGKLVAAMEFKSHKGPSFGNNFNNRSEEAIGTGQCFRTAYREGAFPLNPPPWLGWVMLLEDCEHSRSVVGVEEPHFPVFPEFKGTSYMKRYELLLRRLVREGLYNAAALIVSTEKQGKVGQYSEPAEDLQVRSLMASLAGHAGTFLGGQSYK